MELKAKKCIFFLGMYENSSSSILFAYHGMNACIPLYIVYIILHIFFICLSTQHKQSHPVLVLSFDLTLSSRHPSRLFFIIIQYSLIVSGEESFDGSIFIINFYAYLFVLMLAGPFL